ncbi:amidohydrolase family protein [Alloalcanivorax xenomutans]|uniref:amidohydrolase family protein n=1 Tax=Alloalcanivorax xenomutans TaxID=1094342 RepID=UPI0009B6E684|nr:amidohydrolase family protein [Alloalcanivorax xenomutans]ARB44090.1 amidohydrolase [Alloalcanivorax xenomutans]
MTTTTSQKPVLPGPDRDWLARHQEPVLEPDLAIVDPHHHLWGPPRATYLQADIETDLNAGHRIIGTVFVECLEQYRDTGPEPMRPLGETRFARSVAEATGGRVCTGIVGHADLRLGTSVNRVLEGHLKEGGGRFRGIRQSSVWDPDPTVRTTSRIPPEKLLLDPNFREGFACLAPLGLSFDCWTYFHQLPELENLARAFPDTVIVLDHVGGVLGVGPYAGRRDALFPEWRMAIESLARCANVRIKLGGLGMHSCGFGLDGQPLPPSSEALVELWRPYLDVCLSAFGVERAMFESNFPVDQVSCSYAVLWNAFKRYAAGFSEAEKAALFRENAIETYRLEIPQGQ